MLSGNFYFYSYRDPAIAQTLKAFDEAIQIGLDGGFSESELEEAKLEMVQGLDAPISPGSRGEVAYGWWREKRTTEVRQAFRDRLLALTSQDVIDAIANEIAPNAKRGATVVFAGRELLEKENETLKSEGLPTLPIETI